MAIRFAGKLSDQMVASLIGIVMQQGWDSAKVWLRTQGVIAERIASVPNQLPPNHPYSYVNYENGSYYWRFGDPQRNIHVRLRFVPYMGPSGWTYRWEIA